MSSAPNSTADLRSAAQDSKRDTNRKYKWHLGSVERVGHGGGNVRPHRPSETTYNMKRREAKSAVASLAPAIKSARKRDISETPAVMSELVSDCDSGDSTDEAPYAPPPDLGVMYSYDAPRAPTQGSQIFNVALAKAVQKFEEKETAKLVKNEYDVIDSEGESIGLSPVKKGKGKAKVEPFVVPDEDEDYEFI